MKKELIKKVYKDKVPIDSELAIVKIREFFDRYNDNEIRLSLIHPKNGFYKSKKDDFLKSKYDIKKIIEYFDNDENFIKFYFVKGVFNENIHLYINKKIIKNCRIHLGYISISGYFNSYLKNTKDVLFDDLAFLRDEKNILALKNIVKIINNIERIEFNQRDSVFHKNGLTEDELIEMFGEEIYEREKLIYEVGGNH